MRRCTTRSRRSGSCEGDTAITSTSGGTVTLRASTANSCSPSPAPRRSTTTPVCAGSSERRRESGPRTRSTSTRGTSEVMTMFSGTLSSVTEASSWRSEMRSRRSSALPYHTTTASRAASANVPG